MRTITIAESVDISAPRHEVYEVVTHLERRHQLSPLWGAVKVIDVSDDYPVAGSSYRVRLTQGEEREAQVTVTEFQPDLKFAYRSDGPGAESAVWRLQDVAGGVRLMYEEQFRVADEAAGEGPSADEVAAEVRRTIIQWLANFKRHSELRGTPFRRLVRRIADRWFLPLPLQQRRLIFMIIAMHAISALTFLVAAIGLGITGLIFGYGS